MSEARQQETLAPDEPRTCSHMQRWESAMADGTLRGPMRVYVNVHAVSCPACRAVLRNMGSPAERST